MKYFFIVAFSILVTVSVGTIYKDLKSQDRKILISPLVAGISISGVPEPGQNSVDNDYSGWQTFVNNYSNYQVKHPSDVTVKNNRNGDVSLIKGKVIGITISQSRLTSKDTLNTVIENDINLKKEQLKNNFYLINSISPIAIGSMTALTYNADESGQKYGYFYIPQDDVHYLVVSNKTSGINGPDYLIAEKIIYSIQTTN